MDGDYSRRQRPANWPRHPDGEPNPAVRDYLELVASLAANLTAWREHDPPQRLDPRCDPRGPRGQQAERRAIR
jgi:hypothetical protein